MEHSLLKYLRQDILPSTHCPGCGCGQVLNAFVNAIDDLPIDPDNMIAVTGIRSSSWIPSPYLKFDILHTTHGRAVAFATGVKVIRPQDMPLQVASGNFDLAVTGRDWLREHLYQFPTSPVKELADLGSGRVKIVAVVSNDMPMADAAGLREFSAGRAAPLRVASEYVNIADRYARDNHLGRYRVVPTWGATEAFLPEDADLLIENTETGGTIARHNLKIIDTLFESTACLIGSRRRVASAIKRERIDSIIRALQTGVKLK